jgi:mannose-6-phosphate isomerase-like protein (cupin superfamily)
MIPGVGQVYEFDFDLFDWNEVARAYDYSIKERGQDGVMHDGDNYIILCAECIPAVKEIADRIHSKRRLSEKDKVNCHIYSNMSPLQKTVDMHSDVDDVYIWQVKGTTSWTVEGHIEDLTLENNQMIYIPAGVNHKPTVTMPRISVSFSIQYGAYE